MAKTRIRDIAEDLGVDKDYVLRWAQYKGLNVTSTAQGLEENDEAEFRAHLSSIASEIASAWNKALLEVLVKIERRLPDTPDFDPEPEQRFLRLREALGPRGRIDPAKPVITKDIPRSPSPIPPATARWCSGEVVGVSWLGMTVNTPYEVTVHQGDSTANSTGPQDDDRFSAEGFDPSLPIDRIVIRVSGKPVAVGGPISPWAPDC